MHSSFCSASFWVLRLKLSTSIYDLMLLNVYHFHHHHHPHSYLSIKSLIFLHILTSIEILVLISWIPASENFYLSETLKCCLFVLIPGRQLFDPPSNKGSRNLKNTFSAMRIQLFFSFIFHMEHLVLFKLCCYFPLK